MILLINGLFAQSLRYAQKIILGISIIYLRLFFSHALILNENPHKSTESLMDTGCSFLVNLYCKRRLVLNVLSSKYLSE
jgi:hypothetical protein